MARCELRPEQPQPIPISSVLRGTESESDLERTKRSSAARCVHSWSHSLLKAFFLRRPLRNGGRAAVAPLDCPLSAGGCLSELGGSQSDALDQSVLAQETGGRLSSAGPRAGRERGGLRTRAGAHRGKRPPSSGQRRRGGPPKLPLVPVETRLLLRLAVRGVNRKAAGPRPASTAAPARPGRPRPSALGPAPPPEAPAPPTKVPPIRKRAGGCGGKADGERGEAQDARTGRCGASRLPPGQQVQGPRARPGVERCLGGVTRRAHARVHVSGTVHFVACK